MLDTNSIYDRVKREVIQYDRDAGVKRDEDKESKIQIPYNPNRHPVDYFKEMEGFEDLSKNFFEKSARTHYVNTRYFSAPRKYKLFHRLIQFICKPIIERLDDIMASVQELTDAVQGLTTAWQAELEKISGEIKTLQDAIVASNGKIDPAALDPTVASINALKDAISAFDPLNPVAPTGN